MSRSAHSSRPFQGASGPSSQQLSFTGDGSRDVTEFIRDVQQVAFAQGRQRDDQWCTDYAATCLSGPALTFYFSLDDRDRTSWTKLCRALIKEFSIAPPEPTTSPRPATSEKGLPRRRRGYIFIETPSVKLRLNQWFASNTKGMSLRESMKTAPPFVAEIPAVPYDGKTTFPIRLLYTDAIDLDLGIGSDSLMYDGELELSCNNDSDMMDVFESDVWTIKKNPAGEAELSVMSRRDRLPSHSSGPFRMWAGFDLNRKYSPIWFEKWMPQRTDPRKRAQSVRFFFKEM